MPLLGALQVPTYSRYFKDILANKYEIATLGVDHVKISEQCSAAIANGLEKQKDPGCLTIPCSVGSFKFEKALCDLGASVSIVPRDVFEKLRLLLEPTGMCLELGDNSIRYPLGIAEDVSMKVGHHFIPVNYSRSYAYHWSLRACAWSWVTTPFAIPWASPKMCL
jgi:hypothetical protein